MPLRPIDAIFVHPKERYYVIYKNGDLYRLTRMKLDFESWTRRTVYTDNIENIYLTKSQKIHDTKLKRILKTYDLPPNLHGCNLKFFLGWWESNGYIYTKDNAINIDATQTFRQRPKPATNKAVNLPNIDEEYQTIATSDTINQNSSSLGSMDQNGSSVDAAQDNNTDDLFDSLLEDLSNEVNTHKN